MQTRHEPIARGFDRDASEQPDGAAVLALKGSDEEHSEFRLGTRDHDWHSHLRGQLFCVETGLIQVHTAHGSWLLPPHRAGWIPPGVRHRVNISGALKGWSLSILPAACARLPEQPCVVAVDDLMVALVRRATGWETADVPSEAQERVIAVLLDELQRVRREPLHLPLPRDRRLLRVATALLEQPDDGRTLQEWAAWAGLSPRTLSRLFKGETAISFAQWRQQVRLSQAVVRLSRGESVAHIADALGYATPSNFIAMFRRCFGVSPARYLPSTQPR